MFSRIGNWGTAMIGLHEVLLSIHFVSLYNYKAVLVCGRNYSFYIINLSGPVRLALSKGPDRVYVSLSPLHLRAETDPVSETLCFLIFIIPDDGHSPETQ
jgi:hypothetical protein